MFNYDDDRALIEEFLDTQMYYDRTVALRKLSSVILQPEYAKLLGEVLAYSFFEDNYAAQKLAKALNFGKKQLLALNENFDEYEKECKRENAEESWQNY